MTINHRAPKMNKRTNRDRTRCAVLGGLLVLLVVASPVDAGELLMKSGFRIPSGTVRAFNSIRMEVGGGSQGNVPLTPFRMLDDGMRRYFVGERQVAEENFDVDLERFDKFELKQRRQGGSLNLSGAAVGPFRSDTQFDEHGHRIVTLIDEARERELKLGITTLRPHSCVVTGLNCQWEFQVATTSIPRNALHAMLRSGIEPERPEDRFKVVRFYQQAGMYELALAELDAIATDLPSQKEQAETVAIEARQLLARRLLTELKHRRAAGQIRLSYEALGSFPKEKLGADILRELRQMQTEFDEAVEKGERAKHRLGDLQEGLTAEQRQQVAPLRDEIMQQLDWETLTRLEPFLRLEKDESLSSSEKLALAYSGWVAGDANAITDLSATIRWWQARFQILEYLRAEHPAQRQQILSDLQAIEGIGAKSIEQLIPQLPPIIDSPDLRGGAISQLTVREPGRPRDADEAESHGFRYSVLVPPEFNPHHAYPVIISMHEGGLTPEHELRWWGGNEANPLQAQRHGYLVVAPEYLPPKFGDPLPAPTDLIVGEVLRDVRRRFLIDSDRVFLSGHGRGGDAAFDVALARPDLLAGVLPISGGLISPKNGSVRDAVRLSENSRDLAWYMVVGELDFGLFGRHADWAEKLMKNATDIVLVQYKARGHENFYSEIHRLFDWMELHRRPPEPKEFDLESLRTTDLRLHWVRWSNTAPRPARVNPKGQQPPKPVNAVTVKARILPGENEKKTITVGGRSPITLWLNSQLLDLDKRLSVEVGQPSQRRFHDFLKPEIEAVLEDFRQTGDRQRLHSVRISID